MAKVYIILVFLATSASCSFNTLKLIKTKLQALENLVDVMLNRDENMQGQEEHDNDGSHEKEGTEASYKRKGSKDNSNNNVDKGNESSPTEKESETSRGENENESSSTGKGSEKDQGNKNEEEDVTDATPTAQADENRKSAAVHPGCRKCRRQ